MENQKEMEVVCWVRCAYKIFPVIYHLAEYCGSVNYAKAIYSAFIEHKSCKVRKIPPSKALACHTASQRGKKGTPNPNREGENKGSVCSQMQDSWGTKKLDPLC